MAVNTSYKTQLYVGLFVAFWIVILLIFVAPFDAQETALVWRMQVMHVYGLVFLAGYMLSVVFQNLLYNGTGKWSYLFEIFFYLFLYLVTLPGIVWYYKSEVINGDYPVSNFILEQYIPMILIITPIILVSRRFAVISTNNAIQPEDHKLILRGENKLDVLRIDKGDLVCISAADNYVEVHYVQNGEIKKKILRTTLKKVNRIVPELLRVHRSYLINRSHFSDWKDKNTISLTYMTVPVSKQYKSLLDNPDSFRP